MTTSGETRSEKHRTSVPEKLSDVKWGRVLLAGVIPLVAVNVVLAVLIVLDTDPTVATWLPWAADPVGIEQFGTWGMPVSTVLLTGIVAAGVGRTVETEVAPVHGLSVGLVVVAISLLFGPPGLTTIALSGHDISLAFGPPGVASIALSGFTLFAGWLGGAVGHRW